MLSKTKLCGIAITLISLLIISITPTKATEVVQFVQQPLYGATSRPVADPFAYQELLNEIRLLRKAVEAQNPNRVASTPWTTMYNENCASCHSRSTAGQGNGFVLLEDNGELAQITPVQMLKVVYKTYKGEMPPRKRLSDTDISLVIQHTEREANK